MNTAIAAGEKIQPSQGLSRSSIQSGSMPRNRSDMMFEIQATHSFHFRCRRRSKSCGPCPVRSPITRPER